MKSREYFQHRVIVAPGTDCWLWQGAVDPEGYGRVSVDGINCLAHRIVWEVFRGEIPPDLYVCHSCDVRPCLNPDHLFLGTAKDNSVDASVKGRLTGLRGGNKNAWHYSGYVVNKILAMKANRVPAYKIASEIGCCPQTVYNVLKRKLR